LLDPARAREGQSLAADVRSYNEWLPRQWTSYEAEGHKRAAACAKRSQPHLTLWRKARTRWVAGYAKEFTLLAAVREAYIRGESNEVTHFFDLHLRAVPVPKWAGRVLGFSLQ